MSDEFNDDGFLYQDAMIPIANPNADRTYHVARGGVVREILPLRVYKLTKENALYFLQKADRDLLNMQMQAQEERRQGLKCLQSNEMVMRDLAEKYIDPTTHETKTKPPKLPWLVRLDDPSGLKIYEEALIDARRRKKEGELPDLVLPVPTDKTPARAAMTAKIIDMEAPKESWDADRLKKFLEEVGMPHNQTEQLDRLFKKACAAFSMRKKMAEEAGAIVNVR